MNYAINVSGISTDNFSVVVLSLFFQIMCKKTYGSHLLFFIQVKDIEGETVALIVKKSYHNPEELIGIENKLHVECEYITSSDWYREQTPCRVSVHYIE